MGYFPRRCCMKMNAIQQVIYNYIDKTPNKQVGALSLRLTNGQDGPFLAYLKELGLVTPDTSPEDFKTLCNKINPAANTLLHRGVIKHTQGTRGWALANYLPETTEFLSSPPKGRKAFIRGLCTETEWAKVEEAINLDKQSEPFTLAVRQRYFPTGTADGLLDYNAPTSISQNSHINDKGLTTLVGLGEWNNSANVINEEVRINLLRYTGQVDSVIQYPEVVYQIKTEKGFLPSDILGLDGKALILIDDARKKICRKMFGVRQLLISKLTPELREILDSMRAAEIEVEDEM